MNKPGYEEIKEGWVQYSTWKRVPTCGREKAEEEFEEWYDEMRDNAMYPGIWGEAAYE